MRPRKEALLAGVGNVESTFAKFSEMKFIV
jgi:hypothetical protein